MSKRVAIEVDPEQMPYTTDVTLGGNDYQLTWQWNDIDRHFTVDIADAGGNPIYKGEVVIWGQTLWRLINFPGLPTDSIVPVDESGQEHDIDPGTFGDTVLPLIDDIDDDDYQPETNGGDDDDS